MTRGRVRVPAPSRVEAPAQRPTVRRKLVVGAANDPAERAADDAADRAMAVLRGDDITPDLLTAPSTRIARASEPGGVGLAGGALDAETSAQIDRARPNGRRLDARLRRSMESAFGADFGAVRIHVGPRADELSSRIQARAFTTGSDVFVRRQDYAPSTREGQRLLAHELAHTLQQGGATVARTIRRYTDVPDRRQWKADSAIDRARRSDELEAIDHAVDAYDGARDSDDLALRRRLLYALDGAIHHWETVKGQKKGKKTADGGRKAYVSARQGSVDELKDVVAKKLQSTINAYALELAPLAAELNDAFDAYSLRKARKKAAELHGKHKELYERTVSDALKTTDHRKWFTVFFSAPMEAVGAHPINALTIKAVADFSWMSKAQANTAITRFIEPVAASGFAVQAMQMLQHAPFRQALVSKASAPTVKRLTDVMPFMRITAEAERDIATKATPPSIQDIADSVFEAFLGDQPINGLGYATNSAEFKTVDFLLGKAGASKRAPCMMLSNVLTEVFKALLPGGDPMAAINPIQDTKPLLTKKLASIGNRGILTRDPTFKGNVEQFGTEVGYANVNRIFFGDGHEWLMVGTREYDPTLGISGPMGTIAAQVEPLTFTAKGSRYDASDGKKVTRNKHKPPGGAALLFERSVVIA